MRLLPITSPGAESWERPAAFSIRAIKWLTYGEASAYLEAVDSSGNSTYITEGELRVSHRRLELAPFENLGLPYHTHFESDCQLFTPGEPFELALDLLPTAWWFSPGSRIRFTVAFADADNFSTPVLDPAPIVQLYHDMHHPSFVELPILRSA